MNSFCTWIMNVSTKSACKIILSEHSQDIPHLLH